MEKLIDKRLKNLKQGYLSLLGLLVTIAIICILAFTTFNFYFKRPVLDQSSEKLIQEQNINTTNYQSIISSTKEKLKNATQKEAEQVNEMEKLQ